VGQAGGAGIPLHVRRLAGRDQRLERSFTSGLVDKQAYRRQPRCS
jgi:hypothetical protein